MVDELLKDGPLLFEAEFTVPAQFDRVEQLDVLIAQIQTLRARLAARQPVRILWEERS